MHSRENAAFAAGMVLKMAVSACALYLWQTDRKYLPCIIEMLAQVT
jgi:hypothetical protein